MPNRTAATSLQPGSRGLARLRRLWTLFRNERTDPEPFYRALADLAGRDLSTRYGPLVGRTIVDLGCGPGWYADAFRAAGARVVALDGDADEVVRPDGTRGSALVGDAGRLPLPDRSVDAVFCSNMLEHVQDTSGVVAEVARVLRPGGWAYISWTNWYSPWGGHDMSPYHYLGPTWGPRAYERRHGPPRKNRYGEGLFPVHIGPTLRMVRADHRFALERVEPRYWPWARVITRVP
ncbi:MAG: class I SAM-dependent methyltransferase, partial [Acidimicrobiales bacterium]|nr:class I SAM-dependent methyltransferase [Acidimicrobiales bacterium]